MTGRRGRRGGSRKRALDNNNSSNQELQRSEDSTEASGSNGPSGSSTSEQGNQEASRKRQRHDDTDGGEDGRSDRENNATPGREDATGERREPEVVQTGDNNAVENVQEENQQGDQAQPPLNSGSVEETASNSEQATASVNPSTASQTGSTPGEGTVRTANRWIEQPDNSGVQLNLDDTRSRGVQAGGNIFPIVETMRTVTWHLERMDPPYSRMSSTIRHLNNPELRRRIGGNVSNFGQRGRPAGNAPPVRSVGLATGNASNDVAAGDPGVGAQSNYVSTNTLLRQLHYERMNRQDDDQPTQTNPTVIVNPQENENSQNDDGSDKEQ